MKVVGGFEEGSQEPMCEGLQVQVTVSRKSAQESELQNRNRAKNGVLHKQQANVQLGALEAASSGVQPWCRGKRKSLCGEEGHFIFFLSTNL
jgi:hypothetical protein